MKAIITTRQGGLETLTIEEVNTPVIKPDELLINIKAIGVNPIDSTIRTKGFGFTFPLILGLDFSGIVTEAGPLVSGYKKGDRVVGVRPSYMEPGAYAEFTTVKASQIALLPEDISFETAAALPVAALIAHEAVFSDMKLKQGEKILIHGGAGGVGTFAIQFAKLAGAYVYATSSPENFDYLRELGADEVIDYHQKNFESASGIDAILDTQSGETQALSIPLLKVGGIIVNILAAFPVKSDRVDRREILAINRSYRPDEKALKEILQWVSAQKIKVEIQEIIPFAEVRKAHEIVEAGHVRGKIILNEVH